MEMLNWQQQSNQLEPKRDGQICLSRMSDKDNIWCTYCKKLMHTKDQCWKVYWKPKPVAKIGVSKEDNKEVMHILVAPSPTTTSPRKGSKLAAVSKVILTMKKLRN